MILKHLHLGASLRCIFLVLNLNSFHPLGSGVHQRSWMGKHLWRSFIRWCWCGQRPSSNTGILQSTLIIPLLLQEWVSRAFPHLVTKPWICRGPILVFLSWSASHFNHIPVWAADLLLHIPPSYPATDRAPVALCYFSELFFSLFSFSGLQEWQLPFLEPCSCSEPDLWLQWGNGDSCWSAACMAGRPSRSDLIQILKFSACSALFGTGLVSVACPAAGSSKAPEESCLGILDMLQGFFFSLLFD